MDSTAGDDRRIPLPESADLPALMRERYDLEPEPTPQPTTIDVLEGITEALSRAVELADPKRTAARCLTLTARLRAATLGHVTPDELLASLRRLTQDWGS